jgi:ABC-type bacteriocin/lantibiotic exporter with double-glycine peptidase domain
LDGSQFHGYGIMKEIEEKPVEQQSNEAIEGKPVEHQFSKDFFTGCLALIVIGLILFILVPLLIFVLKLSVLVAVPIGLVAAFVIFTAFFGRIINILRRKW